MNNTMTKFKRRRTKGRTTQWSNLNEEGQRDEQRNDRPFVLLRLNWSLCCSSLCPSSLKFDHCVVRPFVLLRLNLVIALSALH
jgi:hypothetical protein